MAMATTRTRGLVRDFRKLANWILLATVVLCATIQGKRSEGAEFVTGTNEADTLSITHETKFTHGLAGNDKFKYEAGNSVVNGGAGFDTLIIDADDFEVVYSNTPGSGTVYVEGGTVKFANITEVRSPITRSPGKVPGKPLIASRSANTSPRPRKIPSKLPAQSPSALGFAATTTGQKQGVWGTITLLVAYAEPDVVRQGRFADSVESNGRCYCATTFDHEIGDMFLKSYRHTIREICALIGPPQGPKADWKYYNDIQCGNGPPNTESDERECPGRVGKGIAGCKLKGPRWVMPPQQGAWLDGHNNTRTKRVNRHPAVKPVLPHHHNTTIDALVHHNHTMESLRGTGHDAATV